MAHGGVGNVLQYLRRLGAPQGTPDQTDGQLLNSFCTERSEAAFASLVQRHGPLVLAVCARVLRHQEDREDAFQATFLALARDASSVRNRESVAGWLHGVARHIALDIRRAASRRDKYEEKAMTTPAKNPAWEAAWHEVQLLLDEEIRRLPDKYQEPFVLCCLENKSRAEAAARLGLKEGTVGSRLTEARRRLRDRLALRGVELAAVLGTAAVAADAAQAHVPAALAASVTQIALQMASGRALTPELVSPHVLSLVQGVPKAMFSTKVTVGALVLLAMSAVVSGAGVIAYQHIAADTGQGRPAKGIVVADRRAAASDVDNTLWKSKGNFETNAWLPASAAYSADGKLLVVGGTGGRLLAVDPSTGREKWRAEVGGDFAAVAFAADQKSILATFNDGFRTLDAATGRLTGTLEEKDSRPTAIGVFPDVEIGDGNQKVVSHKVILAGARGSFVKVWNDGAPVGTITNGSAAPDTNAVPLAVDPAGSCVIVTGPIERETGKNVIWAWAAGNSSPASPGNRLLAGHEAAVVSAAWSRDGKTAATGDAAGRIIVWDAKTMKEAHRFELGGRIAALALSTDGTNIAAAVVGGKAEFYAWKVADSKKPRPIHINSAAFSGPIHACLTFSPDGQELVGSAFSADWLTKLGELTGTLHVWHSKL
jgi:RNA polymerase sigma factor (sigma-70 family)